MYTHVSYSYLWHVGVLYVILQKKQCYVTYSTGVSQRTPNVGFVYVYTCFIFWFIACWKECCMTYSTRKSVIWQIQQASYVQLEDSLIYACIASVHMTCWKECDIYDILNKKECYMTYSTTKPHKNGEILLWSNTRVVKYYVSQKQNGLNNKSQWYNILLTFTF